MLDGLKVHVLVIKIYHVCRIIILNSLRSKITLLKLNFSDWLFKFPIITDQSNVKFKFLTYL